MVSAQDLKASTLLSLKGFVSLVTGGGTGIGLMAAQTRLQMVCPQFDRE